MNPYRIAGTVGRARVDLAAKAAEHVTHGHYFAPRGIVEIERVVVQYPVEAHDGVDLAVVMRRWGVAYVARVPVERRHLEAASTAEIGNLIEYCVNRAVDMLWLEQAERVEMRFAWKDGKRA